jgi:hypothetical protein
MIRRTILLGVLGVLVAGSVGCCGWGHSLLCCPFGPDSICESGNGCSCGDCLPGGCGPCGRGCNGIFRGPAACGPCETAACGPAPCAPAACGPCGQAACGPCGPAPCGGCGHCGACCPPLGIGILRGIAHLFSPATWCGCGCGQYYWGDFYGDPPACCDPCDGCGNYTGPTCNACAGNGVASYGNACPSCQRQAPVAAPPAKPNAYPVTPAPQATVPPKYRKR